MRIGIDLDETISALPTWFAFLSKAVVSAGHEIHVITNREPGSESEVIAELAEHGVEYSKVHVPTTNVDPPSWKGELARGLELDLMIDDSPEALAKMPAKTARFWLCDPEVFDLEVCIRAMMNAPAPRPVS